MVRGLLVENRTTAAFLADERGPARAVVTGQPAFARTHAWLKRPIFNRPAFLDAAEVTALDHDLGVFLDVLSTLPARFFGGDQAAMARALGLPEAQVEAVARAGGPPVRLGRADLVRDDTAFRLVEFNTSSSLGGCEIAEMGRGMLTDPALREFSQARGLTFGDPTEGMMASLEASCPSADGRPLAVVKWPNSADTADDFSHMELFLAQLTDLGYETVQCHVGRLEYRDGVLLAAGRRVDRVFRTFQLSRLTDDAESRALAAPLLDAVADGAAALFAPIQADVYGIKDCLALLSDEANRSSFDAAELDVIDRMLPWTRLLRAGRTSREGRSVDLVEHVLANQNDLVLKPSAGFAGQGITAGWMVTPDEWTRRVTAAVGQPYVVQLRATPTVERFVDDTDPEVLAPCLLSWGVFHTVRGYSGAFVKGIPHGEQDIRFLGDGSHVGCVFHQSGGSR